MYHQQITVHKLSTTNFHLKLTTLRLHLYCVVKALFVANRPCYIGSMGSTPLLERMFVDILLFADPQAAFSCLSQKGQTWSLPSNGSALFYSPVQWINLQSKGLPPCETLWAQFQHLIWARNWTELKHFCTQLRCNKWQLLQFNLPPVDTAWTTTYESMSMISRGHTKQADAWSLDSRCKSRAPL